MKTNINLELNDADRNKLAVLLDGKTSKRELSRKEVTELTEAFWEALVAFTGDPAPATLAVEEDDPDLDDLLALPGDEPAAVQRGVDRASKKSVVLTPAYLALRAEKVAAGKSADWIASWERGALQVLARSQA